MTQGGAPARSSRRHALAALGALAAWATLEARAAQRTLPISSALPQELAQALAQHQPLVVMVSLHGCPFCAVVRNNYLAPMHEREGLPVVQVNMLDPRATVALSGEPTTHEALVRAWGIAIAPTVLFFGRDGREVAPRLAGGPNDFYSAMLDTRLEKAREAISK
ncbi:MAG: hypothetical protein K8F51_06605 [Comamonas sp.]|nr:hypothetical protein [Comamonas sp.]